MSAGQNECNPGCRTLRSWVMSWHREGPWVTGLLPVLEAPTHVSLFARGTFAQLSGAPQVESCACFSAVSPRARQLRRLMTGPCDFSMHEEGLRKLRVALPSRL